MVINSLATWIPALLIALIRRAEALGQSEDCRDDVGAGRRPVSSTARRDGTRVRRAVCHTGDDEAGVYSRVLLLRWRDRHGAVARRVEGQSLHPDRTALDRRFHSRSIDLFLIPGPPPAAGELQRWASQFTTTTTGDHHESKVPHRKRHSLGSGNHRICNRWRAESPFRCPIACASDNLLTGNGIQAQFH